MVRLRRAQSRKSLRGPTSEGFPFSRRRASSVVFVWRVESHRCTAHRQVLRERSAYEESIRVPFFARDPPLVRPGTSVDRLVLNVDLAPTLLELAGVEVPEAMQGRSLVPLLEDREAEWRTSFVYENYYEPPFETPTPSPLASGAARNRIRALSAGS